MKKITLLAFLLAIPFSNQAQISFEAAPDFGKLQNITYDATTANKLYAATQGNHIVVSTDNGVNWSLLYSYPGSDFLEDLKPAFGNTALSFRTRDAINILSLATNTITTTIPVPQSGVDEAGPSYISSYTLFGNNTNVILVDTGFQIGFSNFGKTFYTNDGGVNWNEIYYTVDHDNVFINNVAINPDNAETLFLARGNGDTGIDGGIWVSKDAGEHWTEDLPGVTVDAIAFNPQNSDDILLGSSIGFGIHPENLFRSADGGSNWNIVPITWTDETLNNITKIVFHPSNSNKIILLEENEIVRSNDGGATWTNTVYPVGIAMDYYYGINASYNPFNENQVAITTDLFPQFSNDGGATLTQIKVPFYNIISTSLGNYNGSAQLYYGSNGGRLHKNIATGVTLAHETELPNSFNPKRNYIVADPVVEGRVFTYASMGFFGGWLTMSTNYGATTTNILQSFADDIQELAVDPANSNIIYAAMRSGEGGSLYKVNFTDLDAIEVIDIITPEINEFGEGVVTGIVIDATNSAILYISKGTKVYKSIDGGLNWEEKSNGLENIVAGNDLIWDMGKNPLNANQLTLTSNVGIFTSTDAAENWSVLLPDLDVKRIKHSPLNDGVIVGTVFSTQFLEAAIVYSTDQGENWTTVSADDLKHVQSYGMDYDFVGNSIHAYVATTDLGVIRYDINDLPLAVNHSIINNVGGIYPNPATEQITVYSSSKTPVTTVSIFSLTGQKVMENNAANIQVSGLSNGVYLVKAQLANGESFTQKLVKE